ncbi:MAG: hypothetical protein ACK4K6_17440, partial [Pseudarthrobacter sp.]
AGHEDRLRPSEPIVSRKLTYHGVWPRRVLIRHQKARITHGNSPAKSTARTTIFAPEVRKYRGVKLSTRGSSTSWSTTLNFWSVSRTPNERIPGRNSEYPFEA